MEKSKHLVFPSKYLKTIFLKVGLSGSVGRENYLGTDMGLNIPDGLNTEVLCVGRIDPEANLILKHNYVCKTANLFDPRLDKTHRLLENTFNWDWSAKRLYHSYNTRSTFHVYECHTEILNI